MINYSNQYLNDYTVAFIPGLFIIIIGLIFFAAKYVRLKQDIGTIKNLLRNKSAGDSDNKCSINAHPKLHSKASSGLWNSISALIAKHQDINQHKNTYNEIIALTGSLTDKITNISQVKQSIMELLAKQLGSGVISIMLISKKTEESNKTAILDIDAAFGLNVKRLQSLILTTFEDLILLRKQAWGYHLSSDSKLPLVELGIGLSLNIPLMLHGEIIGGLWVGFNENSVNLKPHQRQIIQGITEHAAGILVSARHTEKERKTNLQTNHFLIGLSHDLKTPGTSALYGLRDMLCNEQNNLTGEQLSRLKLIEQSLEQQLSMVGDVLEYVKLQKGLSEVYKKYFPIKPTILGLLDSFSFLTKLKNISFNTEQLEDVQISFDLKHFQRIAGNLISNAVKYSLEGGEICIKTEISGDNVEICIIDSGIGIPEEEEKFIFQEFTRLKNSRHVQGNGFGLALCRILAELNTAEVFYRRHEKNTEFGLRVKRERTAVAKQKDHRMPVPQRHKSILIVDDDPIICKTNLRFLTGLAEKFFIANSLEETKNILRECTPDLMVTDLNLKDGQFTKLLSEQDKLNTKTLPAKIPTIILTGYTKNKDLIDLEQKYGVVVLEKPTTRQELQEAVKALADNPK